MKGLLADKVLKQDRFKYDPDRSISKFVEIEEFDNGAQHYFKVAASLKVKYKKFQVNGAHSRIQAYNNCVEHAERNGYTLTVR